MVGKHHYRMESVPNLVDDLRCTIEYIEKECVSISVHPLHELNGNIWAVRGCKENLIVMLFYQNEVRKLVDDDDSVVIKQEPNYQLSESQVENMTDCQLSQSSSRKETTSRGQLHIILDALGSIVGNSMDKICPNAESECENSPSDDHDPIDNISYEPETSLIVDHSRSVNVDDSMDKDSTMNRHDSNETFIIKQEVIEDDAVNYQPEDVTSHALNLTVRNVSMSTNKESYPCNTSATSTPTTLSKEKLYECSLCGKKLTRKSSLDEHKLIHTGEKPYECLQCGKRFSNRSVLSKHKLLHSGELRFECPQCGKKFSQKFELKRHKLVHDGEKPYECLQCGKRFTQSSTLKQHQLIHSGEKPHKCLLCEKAFSDRSAFRRHQLVHSGEKPHECSECGKNFAQKEALKMHLLLHSGEKPYECSECGQKFIRKASLNRHLLVHGGEKQCECLDCGKRFFNKSGYLRHMLVHREEKQHECVECGKRFSQKDSLIQHQVLHSGEKPYECLHCDKKFARKGSLNRHQLSHESSAPNAWLNVTEQC